MAVISSIRSQIIQDQVADSEWCEMLPSAPWNETMMPSGDMYLGTEHLPASPVPWPTVAMSILPSQCPSAPLSDLLPCLPNVSLSNETGHDCHCVSSSPTRFPCNRANIELIASYSPPLTSTTSSSSSSVSPGLASFGPLYHQPGALHSSGTSAFHI